jgi:hypothetical protein
MNAEEVLARTFAEHEGQAPDPETVLAAVHARVTRRRRTIPVVAAAAAVAAIAVGASVLVDQQAPRPPAATPDPIPTEISVDTTWLPAGTARTISMSRSYGRQARVYSVTSSDGVVTTVEVQVGPGSSLAPTNGGGGGTALGFRPHDLTIGGRPAREWRNDTRHQDSLYTVVVRLPDDRVVQVAISVPVGVEGRGGSLAVIGRRVAASTRLDRPVPIDTDFRPTYVPSGLVVQGVSRLAETGTGWVLAAPRAAPVAPAVYLAQDPRAFDRTTTATVVDGRPVQGRPTYVITNDSGITLRVDGFRPGASIDITATRAAAPLDELYKIADGIRWTG